MAYNKHYPETPNTSAKYTEFIDNNTVLTEGHMSAIRDAIQQDETYLVDLDKTVTDIESKTETIDSLTTLRTATGNPITLNNAVTAKAKTLKVTMEPKQDLHGYDKPWVGGSGKNKAAFDQYESTLSGVHAVYSQGMVTLSGTASSLLDFKTSFSFNNSGKTLDLGSGTYVFSIDKYADVNDGSNILYLTIKNNSTGALRYVGVGSSLVKTETVGADESISSMFIRVAAGTSLNNVVIKTFLALASESDGTWTPYSNICPISGYDNVEVMSTGKNLFNPNAKKDNWISLNGTVAPTAGALTSQKIRCANNDSFTISLSNGTGTLAIAFYNGSNELIGRNASGNVSTLTAIAPEGTEYLYAGRFRDSTANVQLELGSTPTSYEPFGYSLSLPLSSIAGSTVYGGTVTVNEDGSGALVVDRAKVTVTDTTSGLQYDGNQRLYIPATAMGGIAGSASSSVLTDATSNQFVVVATNDTYNHTKEGFSIAPSGSCYLYCEQFTSLSEWKTHLQTNNLEIEGSLSTPTTYPLTASQISTLIGTNHIWTDGTKIDLEYRGEKYAMLDKVLNALPSDTATGNPATFPDGADGLPMKQLTVDIQPKQDLHGYDKPWVGGSGKNLYSGKIGRDVFQNNVGATHTNDSDVMTVVMSDSTSSGIYSGTSSIIRQLIGTLNGNYTISMDIRSNEARNDILFGVQGTKTTIIAVTVAWTRISVTAAFNGVANPLVIYNNHGGTGTGCTITVRNLMVEAGSAATDYVPYENICPIEAWDDVEVMRTGKNLINWKIAPANSNGLSVFLKPGTYTISGESALPSGNWYFRFSDGDGEYTYTRTECGFSGYNQASSGWFYGAPNAQNVTFIVPDGCTLVEIGKLSSDGTIAAQLELGSTATAYEPYQQSTLPISLKSITGSSVYGGTVKVYADGTGELVVDRAKVTFTGMSWAVNGTYANTYNIVLPITYPRHAVSDAELNKSLSNKYIWYTSSDVANNDYGFAMSINNDLQFYVKDKDVATATEANAKFNDLEICYPLHYVQTYPLTAPQLETLLGTNTVWCDAGQVTVEYCADTTKYIDKKLAEYAANALNA